MSCVGTVPCLCSIHFFLVYEASLWETLFGPGRPCKHSNWLELWCNIYIFWLFQFPVSSPLPFLRTNTLETHILTLKYSSCAQVDKTCLLSHQWQCQCWEATDLWQDWQCWSWRWWIPNHYIVNIQEMFKYNAFYISFFLFLKKQLIFKC